MEKPKPVPPAPLPPVHPPEPPAPVPVPPVPPAPPSPPVVTGPVTATTPARHIGDLPLTTWRSVLTMADSPMLAEVENLVAAASPHGAMCLATAYKESSLGKTAPRGSFNAWGIGPGDSFESWADGADDFARRLDTVAAPYTPEGITLREYFQTYVGGPLCRQTNYGTCANGETRQSIELYIAQTVDRINQWKVGISPPPDPPKPPAFTAHTVPGAPRPLLLPPHIEVVIAPNKHPRTGGQGPMTPAGTVYHETGNPRVGRDALSHSAWQDAGTPGHPDLFVAVHVYVDDKRAVFKIPLNQKGIHAGDARNQTSIAVEQCINSDGDIAKARDNAMWVHAAILHALGLPASALGRHSDYACPATVNRLGLWSAVSLTVQSRLAQLDTGEPQPPAIDNATFGTAVPDSIILKLFPEANAGQPYTEWVREHYWAIGGFPRVEIVPVRGEKWLYVENDFYRYDPAAKKVVWVSGVVWVGEKKEE